MSQLNGLKQIFHPHGPNELSPSIPARHLIPSVTFFFSEILVNVSAGHYILNMITFVCLTQQKYNC